MPAQNYVLLERVTVGEAGASSITFNSIPQTGYTDLKIVCSVRTTVANTSTTTYLYLNGLLTNRTAKVLYGTGTATGSFSNTAGIAGDTNGNTSTASTFGNQEIYIPNYTSANFKSYSIDAVVEDNSTGTNNTVEFLAGLWSSTAAITSVGLAPSGNTFSQYSSFSLYGLAAVGTTPTRAPKATGGSIIQTDGTYWYHAFLASGTFTPAVGLTCDYLVVAGGGAGGGSNGTSQSSGGGGAGGYRATVGTSGGGGSAESALSLASGTAYTVTIGAGGTCAANSATNGNNSVFSSITSTGGGKGGGTIAPPDYAAAIGGSGGGGTYNGAFRTGAAGTANQGYAGGDAQNTSGGTGGGGGGGGAGAVGGTGNTSVGGAGGAGLNGVSAWATATATGASGYYAGGGGASRFNGSAGAGGSGGGGAGGANTVGSAATANTGSGGGAGSNAIGGNGGSGIVIIRYAV